MQIAVLGPLAIEGAAAAWGRRDRVVLTALATRPGQAVGTDTLAEALWSGDPPASADKVVQGCVSRVRRQVGREAIETVPNGYRLAIAPEALDSVRFERSIARARELVSLGEFDRAAYLTTEALALWRGRAFAELEDWEPARIEAARFEELLWEAQELRVDALIRSGRSDEVLAEAETLVRAAPLRELRWGLLASAQYQAGRQGDALRTISNARSMLVRELGIDPGPELAALEQAILRQDESLSASWPGTTRRTDHRCPYRGLRAYDIADTEQFFGRRGDVLACLRILSFGNVLAIVGPSGFGKSSLAMAGVAAHAQTEARSTRILTPGRHPLDALAAALATPAPHLLVVDQAEELFSICDDPVVRTKFVDRLAAFAESGQVVLSLRTDRLADVATYPPLARMIESGLHLLGPMSEQSLREVIEAPARQQGLLLEPGLVDLLVREVEGEPGALPMLSYALQETWQRREGNTLTVAGYQATGGIRGAVAQAAEALYKEVDPTLRYLLRDVLLRLVAPGPDAEPVRTRLPRRLVVAEAGQEHLVDRLVGARLVTSDEGMVEIAHESLARAWPRLRGWLDDDVEGQRIRHHLIGASDAWDSMGRLDSELYRGARLRQALEWRDAAHRELSANERDFLAEAERKEQSEQAVLAARAEEQARMVRRLRGVVAVGAVLLAFALIAGGLAVRQTRLAERNQASATAAGLTAEAGRLGARALTVADPVTALLLAAEGVETEDSLETRSYLRDVLERSQGLTSTSAALGTPWGFTFDPSGRRFIVAGLDDTVSAVDIESGQELRRAKLRGAAPYGPFNHAPLQFSEYANSVAVAVPDFMERPVQLLDGVTLEPVRQQLRGQGPGAARVFSLDLSDDGRFLAASMLYRSDPGEGSDSGLDRSELLVWDLEKPDGRPWRIPADADLPVDTVQVSRDGRTVFASAPLRAHSADRGRVWSSDHSSFQRIALSPDERLLFGSSADGLVVVDARDGNDVATIADEQSTRLATWSPSGNLIAAVVGDEVRVWSWSAGDREPTLTITIPAVEVYDVHFSPDGSHLHVISNGAIQTWDLSGSNSALRRHPLTWPMGGEDLLWALTSPDGRYVAGYTRAGPTVVLDSQTGAEVVRTEGSSVGQDFIPFGWSPDSTSVVVGLGEGDLEILRVEGSRERHRITDDSIYAVEYTRDGGGILIATHPSQRVWLVSAETLEPVTEIYEAAESSWEYRLLPDDHSVFVMMDGATPDTAPWQTVDLRTQQVTSGVVDVTDARLIDNLDRSPANPPRVAVAYDRGTLLVDLTTGETIGSPVAAHGDQPHTLAFAADGSRYASGALDGSVALWDGHTGELLDVVTAEPGVTPYPSVSDDGTVVITTRSALYEWDSRITTALSAACQMAGRSLTADEWSQHVGDRPYHETCPPT